MIRGGLESIGIIVKAYFVRDVLQGETDTVIRVAFLKVLEA